ncbi:MAG: hypothetical protein ACOCUU_03475 [Nanoarchaeota archaeon]
MRKKALIKKLKKEGKLKLVEPSDEISESYSEKSGKSFEGLKRRVL